MERSNQQIKALAVPIENRIKQICVEYMDFEPSQIDCTFLHSFDLVITIERKHSATEALLRQQGRVALSKEIGHSVNQAFRERIALMLVREFELPVREVSTLKPAASDKFSLMVLIG